MNVQFSRRQFMKVSAAAALALAITRSLDREVLAQAATATALPWRRLRSKDAELIAALAPAILAGSLPEDAASRQLAISEVVAAFDRTVAGLPPTLQAEVDELLSLLTFGLTRRFIAGVATPWPQAGEAEVKAFLDRWRNSRFATFQQGYQALARALIACWYGNPRSWTAIGYPGAPHAQQLGAA